MIFFALNKLDLTFLVPHFIGVHFELVHVAGARPGSVCSLQTALCACNHSQHCSTP